ncbi:hypothetical protein [Endozoicomonas atrinae]|uniref:hypothetical protein n=1 Tax=Endozoicomonas atrinae TaxID=1333660 RepID=UPI003B00E8D1
MIYQFFVEFYAHCYSPFWSINDKRLHNLNYIPEESAIGECIIEIAGEHLGSVGYKAVEVITDHGFGRTAGEVKVHIE